MLRYLGPPKPNYTNLKLLLAQPTIRRHWEHYQVCVCPFKPLILYYYSTEGKCFQISKYDDMQKFFGP